MLNSKLILSQTQNCLSVENIILLQQYIMPLWQQWLFLMITIKYLFGKCTCEDPYLRMWIQVSSLLPTKSLSCFFCYSQSIQKSSQFFGKYVHLIFLFIICCCTVVLLVLNICRSRGEIKEIISVTHRYTQCIFH